jgi:hypothetical protein
MRMPEEDEEHVPQPVKFTADWTSQVPVTAERTQLRWVASLEEGFSQQTGMFFVVHTVEEAT